MVNMKYIKRFFSLCLVFTIFPIFAFSHGVAPAPFLLCKKDNTNIVCVGGFSNGMNVRGSSISLIKLENGKTSEVLEKKVFDRSSKVVFENIPKDDFYILMNIGNGTNSIEVLKGEVFGLN